MQGGARLPDWMRWVGAQGVRSLLLLALGGLLGATLVWLSPGSDVDERELELHVGAASAARFRAAREMSVWRFYGAYLGSALRGDLGVSTSLNRPVRDLLRERLPVTLRSVGGGLAWAAAIALVAAVLATSGGSVVGWAASTASTVLLCVPIAVLALLLFSVQGTGTWAVALVVFPRAYRYAHGLLAEGWGLPHVLVARARGVAAWRVLVAHVLLPVLPGLAAVCALLVNVALGASVPLEALRDEPGVGQLAWRAALSRDVPLLVAITWVLLGVTLVANTVAEAISAAAGPRLWLGDDRQ